MCPVFLLLYAAALRLSSDCTDILDECSPCESTSATVKFGVFFSLLSFRLDCGGVSIFTISICNSFIFDGASR